MKNGALWWNKAYEAAGFKNAVQVKDPTPDMDPMDIRYSWILWINRDERGFSSGGSFRDPRTGEQIVEPHRARRINAIMLGCGLYDNSGEFAFRVGLPGKSGVGGGILCIAPGRGSIAVWSPGLNEAGTSLAGAAALEHFAWAAGWSVFG